MALREILAKFGVEVDDKPLNRLDGKIGNVFDKLEKLGAALAGGAVGMALKGFIVDQVELGSRINDTATRLGVGTDALQEFEYAAQLSGVGAESMDAALGKMNRTLGEALTGNDAAAKAFAKFGVAITDAHGQARPLDELFADMSDGLGKMGSQAEKTAAITEVFGRSAAQLLPIMEDGSKGVRKYFEEAQELGIVLGKDFVKSADAAGDQLDRFHFVVRALKAQLATSLLPIVTSVMTKITNWGSKAIALAKSTNAIKVGMVAVGAAGLYWFTKLNSVVKLLTMSPIAVGLTGLFLLFEDLFTMMRGGRSVIGETMDKLYGAGAAADFAQQLWAAWGQVKAALIETGPAFKVLGDMAMQTLPPILNVFVWLVKIIGAGVTLLGGFVKAVGAMGEAFSEVRKKGGNVFDSIFSKEGAVGSLLGPGSEGKAGIAIDKSIYAAENLLSMPKPRISSDVAFGPPTAAQMSQTNQNTITINGATDPIATGRQIQSFVRDGAASGMADALAATSTRR